MITHVCVAQDEVNKGKKEDWLEFIEIITKNLHIENTFFIEAPTCYVYPA